VLYNDIFLNSCHFNFFDSWYWRHWYIISIYQFYKKNVQWSLKLVLQLSNYIFLHLWSFLSRKITLSLPSLPFCGWKLDVVRTSEYSVFNLFIHVSWLLIKLGSEKLLWKKQHYRIKQTICFHIINTYWISKYWNIFHCSFIQ